MIGLPTFTALRVLWIIGGSEYVARVWSGPPAGPPPYRLPFLPSLGLIIVAVIGAQVGCAIWRAFFFCSGFIDEVTFERYFDNNPRGLFLAVPALILSGLAA